MYLEEKSNGEIRLIDYHVNEVFSDYRITEVHVNADIRLLALSDYSQLSDYCVHVTTPNINVLHYK